MRTRTARRSMCLARTAGVYGFPAFTHPWWPPALGWKTAPFTAHGSVTGSVRDGCCSYGTCTLMRLPPMQWQAVTRRFIKDEWWLIFYLHFLLTRQRNESVAKSMLAGSPWPTVLAPREHEKGSLCFRLQQDLWDLTPSLQCCGTLRSRLSTKRNST